MPNPFSSVSILMHFSVTHTSNSKYSWFKLRIINSGFIRIKTAEINFLIVTRSGGVEFTLTIRQLEHM